MVLSTLRSRTPAGDRRGRWTAVAAAAFTAGGFLAALVGTTVLLVLAFAFSSPGPNGPVSLEEVGGVVLWFAAPTIGAVVVGVPAWWLTVEVVGWRVVGDDPDRSRLAYPGLGGLAGLTSGLLAHVVMWLIIMVVVAVYETPVGPGDLAEAIVTGLYLGVLSIGFTGIISGPILAAVGGALGWARDQSLDRDRGASRDADGSDGDDDPGDGWERVGDDPTGA